MFAGRSAIIAPDGTVLAEAGEGEELIWADCDPEIVKKVRQTIPVFEDRMPDCYI